VNVLAWPVLLPLFGGSVLLLVRRSLVRRWVSTAVSAATLAVSIAIAVSTFHGEVLVVQMAAWAAPFGITLAADGLAGLLLLASNVLGLLTVVFAGSSLQHAPVRGDSALLNRARDAFGAQALLQFLFMGVNMCFLTGDLFNLFVAFEVMLLASYGLLLLGGELPQLREGFKYVVINLMASSVFVVTAGLVYGLVGSLNMADIAQRVSAHGGDPRITLLAALLALVFATKAAVFPLGFWLPDSYPVPPAAVSAYFAAVLTKVGVYALLRTFTLMFPSEHGVPTLLFALAGVTMLVGALGAVARRRWRHAMAFANVASIGYLVAGVFIGTHEGMTAALYYLLNSVAVIFVLFLVAALAERIAGPRYREHGHLGLYPWLGAGYFTAALALTGLPPTSGFIGKFALVRSMLAAGTWLPVTVATAAVLTGLLLLYATMRIWREFFWGEADAVHRVAIPRAMSGVTAVAVALLLSLAVFAGPLYGLCGRVATQLDGNAAYRAAVLVPDAPPREGAH
jgi:multicomponent Na+:H+ antiporter subunit D